MKILVYHCSGEGSQPWLVGLYDGHAVTQIYNQFRNPLEAIRFALDNVAAKVDLPVVWPQWLKVVVA